MQISEIIMGNDLPNEVEDRYFKVLAHVRARISEYGLHGMDPEDAVCVLSRVLGSYRMSIRHVTGSDAARIEITDDESGYARRYDWEGPKPLANLLENKLRISTAYIDPVFGRECVIGEGPGVSRGSLKERLSQFRENAEPFEYRMELRTKAFRKLLEDASMDLGLRFVMTAGIPEYYDCGITPFSRTMDQELRIEDRTDGTTVWEGTAKVVDDGHDVARMRAFRRVFESTGLFRRIPTEGGVSIIERWDLDDSRGIEW